MAVAAKTKKPTELSFFGLPEEHSNEETAQVVVIPAPYENTTSYGRGTKSGPKAILDASQQVELFDDELWVEPFRVGIASGNEVKMAP